MDTSTIYFAGGCFWGVEKYFSNIFGVLEIKTGYANGKTSNPTYEEVCSGDTGFAEAVEVKYNSKKVSLKSLLRAYFSIIDPTSLNRQGFDTGTQYRSGIYYINDLDAPIIEAFLEKEQKKYSVPIVVEVEKLKNFYDAEEYHQRYLDKNPQGYCHIPISNEKQYLKPDEEEIKAKLNENQYKITRQNGTEIPNSGVYNDFFEEGIYVDVVNGEPLFSSRNKFRCKCGWPSFSMPIKKGVLIEKPDNSHLMQRIEVRSKTSDSHLGHVFEDGPFELGGRRYCINSGALNFIPKHKLEKEGYGEYLTLFG